MHTDSFECAVTSVEHPSVISQPCRICRKILARGKYTIGIILTNTAGSQSFFVSGPPAACCGETKKNLIFLTDNLEEADRKADEVVEVINRTGDTSTLSLIHANEIVPPDPKAN